MKSISRRSLNQNSLPNVIAAALAISAALVVGLHIANPVAIPISERPETVDAETTSLRRPFWSLAEFESVWHKELLPSPPKLPVVTEDVTAIQTKAEVPPPPRTIPLKLKSILVSDESKLAVFEDMHSANELIRLTCHEVFRDVKVVRIEADFVQIWFDNRLIELRPE